MHPSAWTRRQLISVRVGALVALAGCRDGRTGDAQPTDSGPTSPGEATTVAPTDGSSDSTDGDLDLREANVTAVAVTGQTDSDYRFEVTLYHDDDGEDGYADWWQVETLSGDRLGRRTLLHAHSTAPFTRSETIAIPSDVDCVVVRVHDRTHGYGGQAMLVTVAIGATREIEQGPRPTVASRSVVSLDPSREKPGFGLRDGLSPPGGPTAGPSVTGTGSCTPPSRTRGGRSRPGPVAPSRRGATGGRRRSGRSCDSGRRAYQGSTVTRAVDRSHASSRERSSRRATRWPSHMNSPYASSASGDPDSLTQTPPSR